MRHVPYYRQEYGAQGNHGGFIEERRQILEFGVAEVASICKTVFGKEIVVQRGETEVSEGYTASF